MYTQLFPILTTPHLERALHFYRDLLGAAVTYSFPGPDGRPAYVGLELGASHLGLGQDPAAAGADRRAISLWVYATDCDAGSRPPARGRRPHPGGAGGSALGGARRPRPRPGRQRGDRRRPCNRGTR